MSGETSASEAKAEAKPKPELSIALALIWKDGRLLLSRRPQGVHLSGFWEFPGGKIKTDETPEHCAEREALEETGVTVRAVGRRPALGYDYSERRVLLIPIDCEWVSGEATPVEVAEVRWATTAELRDFEFPPANAPLIAALATGHR